MREEQGQEGDRDSYKDNEYELKPSHSSHAVLSVLAQPHVSPCGSSAPMAPPKNCGITSQHAVARDPVETRILPAGSQTGVRPNRYDSLA